MPPGTRGCNPSELTGSCLLPISRENRTHTTCKVENLSWNISVVPVGKSIVLTISFTELKKCPSWRMKIEANITFFVDNVARKSTSKVFELEPKMRRKGFCFSESFLNETRPLKFAGNEEIMIIKITVLDCFGFRRRINFKDDILNPYDLQNLMLIIEDKKVFVNVNFLATYSNYFFHMKSDIAENKLKIDPESGVPFETLRDVDYTSFFTILGVLYPKSQEITAENVEGVLKVADYLMFETVLIKCENFLLSSKAFSNCKKLELSLIYQMFDLQDQCLSQICSIRQIKEDPFSESLSDQAKALLMDQLLSNLKL